MRTGEGTADIVINRAAEPAPGPSTTVPKTGDGLLPVVVVAAGLLVAGVLTLCVAAIRRGRKRRMGSLS